MHLPRNAMQQTLAAIILPLALGFAGYGRPATPMPLAAPAEANTLNHTGSGSMSRYAEAIEQLSALLEDSDIPLYKILDGWSLSSFFYVSELGKTKQIYEKFTAFEQRILQDVLYYVKRLLRSRYGFNDPGSYTR